MDTLDMNDVIFVHLSDTHIQPEGQTFWDVIDGYEMTIQALTVIEDSDLKPDFFIISGDLAQDSDYKLAYARVKAVKDHMDNTFKVPVLLALGNHDERAIFRQVVMSAGDSQNTSPYYYSQYVAGLKVIVLDTNGYQSDHGSLDDEQLAWLRDELQNDSETPCLLVCHHPPIPVGINKMNAELLDEPHKLREIIAPHSKRILAILSGHIHHANVGGFAGTLCATATGLAFTVDPTVQDRIRCLNGCGFSVVHVHQGKLLINPYDLSLDPIEVASL